MKKTMFCAVSFLTIGISANLNAQVSELNNVSPVVGTPFIGWDNTGLSRSLNIRNDFNQPIIFQTNGANERMRIDGVGRIGLGVIPSTDSWLNARLTVGGPIRWDAGFTGTILYGSTTVSGNPSPVNSDGFRMKFQQQFFTGTNTDALIFEKTDGNNPTPDGGIVFTNTGNDGIEIPAFYIRGTGRTYVGNTF